MTAAAPAFVVAPKLTRESVYAFVWDKVPEHFRGSICAIASLGSSWALLGWDELTDDVRHRLGVSIADLIEAHDHNRKLDKKNQIARAAP